MTELIEVSTTLGTGALHLDRAQGQPRGALLLGHGAGGSIVGVDLVALAELLPSFGYSVLRYVQPWKVAGRKMTARPAQLDQGWLPAVDAARAACPGSLLVGGHSAGARVACRTASVTGVVAVLALSFPLHPPGKPEATRADELLGVGVPTLVLQGERDTFGTAAQVSDASSGHSDITVITVPAAGHDLKLLKSAPVSTAEFWATTVEQLANGWLAEQLSG